MNKYQLTLFFLSPCPNIFKSIEQRGVNKKVRKFIRKLLVSKAIPCRSKGATTIEYSPYNTSAELKQFLKNIHLEQKVEKLENIEKNIIEENIKVRWKISIKLIMKILLLR